MALSRERQDYINAWKRSHPARRREWHQRDRLAKYRGQFERQYGLCYWCGAELSDRYTVDHILPRSRGGLDSPENTVLACRSCNSSKQDKTDWLPTEVTVVPIYCYW